GTKVSQSRLVAGIGQSLRVLYLHKVGGVPDVQSNHGLPRKRPIQYGFEQKVWKAALAASLSFPSLNSRIVDSKRNSGKPLHRRENSCKTTLDRSLRLYSPPTV